METTIDDEGHTKYIYKDDYEYMMHQKTLYRTIGRRKMLYEGWLNGKLVRIVRK